MAKLMIFVMAFSVFAFAQPAQAGAIHSTSVTMTTLTTNTDPNYVVAFKLPSGIQFDATTASDVLIVDFIANGEGGLDGWYNIAAFSTSDFVVSDGTTTYTINSVTQGAGASPAACDAAGTNEVEVGIDETTFAFKFKACLNNGFTPSIDGNTITININTTSGHMSTPSNAGAHQIDLLMTDEGTAAAHNGVASVGIVDSDTVTFNAQIDPSITFDIDIDSSSGSNGNSSAPYLLDLGRWAGAASHYSGVTYGSTTVNYIELDLGTNAFGGLSVTVADTDATRTLTSGTDNIGDVRVRGDFSTDTGYGICVMTGYGGTIDVAQNFDGDVSENGCSASDHVATTPPAAGSPATVLSTTEKLADTWVEIAVKSRTAGTEAAHTNYQTSIRFIATATF